MKFQLILLALLFSGCTTIHFRSGNSIPVTFTGNGEHQKEISISGKRDFYFWGTEPEHEVVMIDEEVRAAGYDSISKVIIYEQKSAQDNLIKFLTLGLYMPASYTITGFTSGNPAPQMPTQEPESSSVEGVDTVDPE